MVELIGGEDVGSPVVIECHLEGLVDSVPAIAIRNIDYLHYPAYLVSKGKSMVLAHALSRRVGSRTRSIEYVTERTCPIVLSREVSACQLSVFCRPDIEALPH